MMRNPDRRPVEPTTLVPLEPSETSAPIGETATAASNAPTSAKHATVVDYSRRGWIRFDWREWSGSVGDLGTDLPLLIGMILAANLDGSRTLLVFGCCQILTGLVYGLPMPMQPLKAMAVILIAQQGTANQFYAGGILIGLLMLLLTGSGLLAWFSRWLPLPVIRGLQVGLGLKLAEVALHPRAFATIEVSHAADSSIGQPYLYGIAVFLGTALLWRSRLQSASQPFVPWSLILVATGSLVGLTVYHFAGPMLAKATPMTSAPAPFLPTWLDWWLGFWIFTLPQLPLSLSNSVFATHRALEDWFPQRRVPLRKIGFSYALLNLFAPILGGVPVCHGCGGLAGHYILGARTGGSVILYGSLYLVLGLLCLWYWPLLHVLFPAPILGALLLTESLALLQLLRDQLSNNRSLILTLLVALAACRLPQGFLLGMFLGLLLHYILLPKVVDAK